MPVVSIIGCENPEAWPFKYSRVTIERRERLNASGKLDFVANVVMGITGAGEMGDERKSVYRGRGRTSIVL